MNLPNKLTISRIILVPFIMFFYLADFIPGGYLIALILFGVAALTDLFDGKIARKRGIVTNFGKFLDPIADKVLTTVAFLLLICDGTIAAPFGVIALSIIITREFAVAALRQVAASKGVVVAADKWGKYKTVLQMATIVVFFVLRVMADFGWLGNATLNTTILAICYTLLGVSIVLTIISGINYLVVNKKVFAEIE